MEPMPTDAPAPGEPHGPRLTASRVPCPVDQRTSRNSPPSVSVSGETHISRGESFLGLSFLTFREQINGDFHRPHLRLLMKTYGKKLDSVASAGLHQRALGSQSSGVNNQVKSNENSLLFVIENNL